MKNLFIILFIFSILSAIAQKKKTYFDKATTVEVTSGSDSIQAMLDDYERIQLPPLSVFLESVYDHPSIKIYEAKKDEANAEMKVTKRESALYNAQMKISEQDFINGKIDITTLAMERGRRSGAVISYQEGRATLHNAVTLLEMLTNVKIINR